jgi:hypothetical protein
MSLVSTQGAEEKAEGPGSKLVDSILPKEALVGLEDTYVEVGIRQVDGSQPAVRWKAMQVL